MRAKYVLLTAESINAPRRVSARQKEIHEDELRRYRVLGLTVPPETLDKFIEVLGEQGVQDIMTSNTPTTATIVYQGRRWEVGETTVEPYSEKKQGLFQREAARKTSSEGSRSTIQEPGEVKAIETVLTNVVEDVDIQDCSNLAHQRAETEGVEVVETGIDAGGDEVGRKAKVDKSLPATGDSNDSEPEGKVERVLIIGILFILTPSVRSGKSDKQRRLKELEEVKRKFMEYSWEQTAVLLGMAKAEGITAEEAEESGYNELLQRSREEIERWNVPSDYALAIEKSEDGVSESEELGDSDEEGSSKSGQSPSETGGQNDGEAGDGGARLASE